MRILVDTNIILDFILNRPPCFEFSAKIIEACKQEIVIGVIAAHSITNIMYILRKHFTFEDRQAIVLNLLDIFEIEPIDRIRLENSLKNNNFSDFEDCVQMECAISAETDYIVTNNIKDFTQSIIPYITPEEFCKLYFESSEEE